MKRVFGKKKVAPPAPSLSDASKGLGHRMDNMDGKINSLEAELKDYKDKMKRARSPAAKKMLQKRAMEVLKRKRMYETQRDAVAGQQFNVDQAAFGMESTKASIDTVTAMKVAGQQMKQTMKNNLNINDVEDLADNMADLMEDFNEINEVLGQNFATPVDLDEADLDAELELLEDELEEEEEVGNMVDSTPSYMMPSQPTNIPESKISTQVDQYGLPIQTA